MQERRMNKQDIFNLLFLGCLGFAFFMYKDIQNQNQSPVKMTIIKDSKIENVTAEFKKIQSKEDQLLIHKLFAGSAEYLNNSKSLSGTYQFEPMLGKVQTSYGWEKEKYPKFTDAVSEYLISVGYDKPKELKTESERKEFAIFFETLAEATKYE
jgi:hypothetical protein